MGERPQVEAFRIYRINRVKNKRQLATFTIVVNILLIMLNINGYYMVNDG